MKRKKTIKQTSIFVSLAMLFTCFATGASAASNWPSINNSNYMKVYPMSTGNDTKAYTDGSLSNKKGTIYAEDEIYVYSINDQYAYCSYPLSSGKGRKYAYIPTSAITPNNVNHAEYNAKAKIITYTRKNLSTQYGYISKGDHTFVVSKTENSIQVIYPISNSKFKMAWITLDDYNMYLKEQSAPIETPKTTTKATTRKKVTPPTKSQTTQSQTTQPQNISNWDIGISSSNYMKTFTIYNQNTKAYTDGSLSNKKGTIYAEDEIYVYSINDQYAYCSYPLSSGKGRKYAYIPTSAITPNNLSHEEYNSKAKITTYNRNDLSSQYGYISSGDHVRVVSRIGDSFQVIYNIDNSNFKMAWISLDDYNLSKKGTAAKKSAIVGINFLLESLKKTTELNQKFMPNPNYKMSSSYKSGIYYKNLMNVKLNGNGAHDIVEVAKSQIEYKSGKNNNDLSGSTNSKANVKYSEYGYAMGTNPSEWCAHFVSWCARQAGISESVLPNFASCNDGYTQKLPKEAGCTIHDRKKDKNYVPQKGDIIFFKDNKGNGHVGIVDYSETEKGIVYYIDGNNTSTTPRKVNYSHLALTDSYIRGYATPKYC